MSWIEEPDESDCKNFARYERDIKGASKVMRCYAYDEEDTSRGVLKAVLVLVEYLFDVLNIFRWVARCTFPGISIGFGSLSRSGPCLLLPFLRYSSKDHCNGVAVDQQTSSSW